jgi:membrane protease YdiL (CAAX protease family)
MSGPSFSSSQITLLAAPPVLLATTYFAFKVLAARLAPARGYLLGFLFYWICWCLLLSLFTVGPGGLRAMFKAPHPTFGKPNWLGLLLLLGPPVAVYVTTFPAEAKASSLHVAIYSALFALANGTMEEVLWRGTYVTAFPDSWLWAYVYPSIWFGLWHLSPQVVYPSEMPGGAIAFALMSVALGLVWGWVAKTTGSIRWVVVAHILLNFAGLPARSFL